MKTSALIVIFLMFSGLAMDAAKRASQVDALSNRVEKLEAQLAEY